MSPFNSDMYALCKRVNPKILDFLLTLVKSVQRTVDRKKLNAKRCPLNADILNCRVQLTSQKRDDSVADAFSIEFAGSIHAAGDGDCASVQILISDITEGIDKAKPVRSLFTVHSSSMNNEQSTTNFGA